MRIPLNDQEVSHWCHQPRCLPVWVTYVILFFLMAASAQAAYAPQSRIDSLDLPDAVWDAGLNMQVSDIPLHVRSFTSVRRPVQLAQALASHADIFQRILTGKHKIILSGLQPGWHWLAHIDATPEGSQGYVSALYVDAARLNPVGSDAASTVSRSTAHDPVYQWLPATARRRLSHRTTASSQVLTQQIYSVPVPVERVLGDVALGLASQGWQAGIAVQAAGGPHTWSHKDQTLMLFAHDEPQGSSVLVHHTQKTSDGGLG